MTHSFENRLISFLLMGSVIGVIIFFYTPILTLIVFSFKEGRFLNMPFEGWTLSWYSELINHPQIKAAALNSFLLATFSTLISTAIGFAAAHAWVHYQFRGKAAFFALTMAPLIFPQLLLGVVLLLWFSVLGNLFHFSNGLWTALIGHCVYLVPFTTIIISVQARGFDKTLERAAQDLGASTWAVFREVTFPIMWPGVFSAASFAFLLSWGNFYITYSLAGSARSVPTFVFGGIALGSTPLYPALATVTFVAGLLLVFAAEWGRRRAAAKTASDFKTE